MKRQAVAQAARQLGTTLVAHAPLARATRPRAAVFQQGPAAALPQGPPPVLVQQQVVLPQGEIQAPQVLAQVEHEPAAGAQTPFVNFSPPARVLLENPPWTVVPPALSTLLTNLAETLLSGAQGDRAALLILLRDLNVVAPASPKAAAIPAQALIDEHIAKYCTKFLSSLHALAKPAQKQSVSAIEYFVKNAKKGPQSPAGASASGTTAATAVTITTAPTPSLNDMYVMLQAVIARQGHGSLTAMSPTADARLQEDLAAQLLRKDFLQDSIAQCFNSALLSTCGTTSSAGSMLEALVLPQEEINFGQSMLSLLGSTETLHQQPSSIWQTRLRTRLYIVTALVAALVASGFEDDDIDALGSFANAVAAHSIVSPRTPSVRTVPPCSWAQYVSLLPFHVESSAGQKRQRPADELDAITIFRLARVATAAPSTSQGHGHGLAMATSAHGPGHGQQILPARRDRVVDCLRPDDGESEEDEEEARDQASRMAPGGELRMLSKEKSQLLTHISAAQNINSSHGLACADSALYTPSLLGATLMSHHITNSRNTEGTRTVQLHQIPFTGSTDQAYIFTRSHAPCRDAEETLLSQMLHGTSNVDTVLDLNHSFLLNAMLLEASKTVGLTIRRTQHGWIADNKVTKPEFSSSAGIAAWFDDKLAIALDTVLTLLAFQLPILSSRPRSALLSTHPCHAIRKWLRIHFIAVIDEAKRRWKGTVTVAWLFHFLLCDFVFMGRAHPRLHDQLAETISSLASTKPCFFEYDPAVINLGDASVASTTQFSSASQMTAVPLLMQATGPWHSPMPATMSPPQRSTFSVAGQRSKSSAADQLAHSFPGVEFSAASAQSLATSWAACHPSEPRPKNRCSYCGSTDHRNRTCSSFTQHLANGGAKFPRRYSFNVSYTDAAAAATTSQQPKK